MTESRPLPPINTGSSLVAAKRAAKFSRENSFSSSVSEDDPTSASHTGILRRLSQSISGPPTPKRMPSGNNVHWSESELADAERPAQSPGTRNRSQSELVLQAVQKAIERHPSFARKLGLQIVPNEDAESTGGPQKQSSETQVTGQPKFLSREYWGSRAFWRHTFYVVISIALLVVVAQLLKLQRSTKEQRFVVERALRKQGGLGPVVKSALTTQGALIAVNLFIAYRGVQIWQLIQRVKVVDVLQRVGWVDPFTRHSGRVIKLVTMPVRSAVRGLTAPGRAAAERRAQQAALEALVQSRASGWRPLSAPITTAWRMGEKAASVTGESVYAATKLTRESVLWASKSWGRSFGRLLGKSRPEEVLVEAGAASWQSWVSPS